MVKWWRQCQVKSSVIPTPSTPSMRNTTKNSKARTDVVAQHVSAEISEQIRAYAIKAFKGMKLRHLSRIDFFLTADNEILLNEINTFPGSTPISMFPKMLQNHGHDFTEYLSLVINGQLTAKS